MSVYPWNMGKHYVFSNNRTIGWADQPSTDEPSTNAEAIVDPKGTHKLHQPTVCAVDT